MAERCVSCGKPLTYVKREYTALYKGQLVQRVGHFNNHKCSTRHEGARKTREHNYQPSRYDRFKEGCDILYNAYE